LQFDPAALEVIADQPVKLTLQNNGALEHDFTVLHIPLAGKPVSHEEEGEMAGHDMSGMSEQPELHVVAPAGKSNLLEFAPAEPGQYEFYCTVPGHKDAGMVGTLTVKAP
jgi:uncharacterized cupredoxin-like copper-binding protein